MKKILLVTTISNTVNAFLLDLIYELQESKFEVSIATSIVQKIDIEKVNVFNISMSRNPMSSINFKARRQLKRIIYMGDFDIVHCHTPIASMLVRSLNIKKRIGKMIYTAHGFHFYRGAPLINWLIYFPVEFLLSFKTDLLITINKEDYQFSKKYLKPKSVKLVKGVGVKERKTPVTVCDQTLKKLISRKKDFGIKYILSIGELNLNKNHKLVIDSLDSDSFNNIEYIICGVGGLEKELNKYILDLGLEKRIHLVGFKNNIGDYLDVSDIFAFPSKREGLPVSVMEAMIHSIPIIVTNTRGSVDLISNMINGIVINQNCEEMRSSINFLLENTQKTQEMVSKSKEIINEFTIEKINPLMISIYKDLANLKDNK